MNGEREYAIPALSRQVAKRSADSRPTKRFTIGGYHRNRHAGIPRDFFVPILMKTS